MLSDGQKRRRMTAGLLNSALVFGLLGAPIVLTPLAFLVLGSPWEALGGFLGFIPCLCALPVFALGVLFLTQWPYVSDLNAGRLETIEGKLTEREVVSHSNLRSSHTATGRPRATSTTSSMVSASSPTMPRTRPACRARSTGCTTSRAPGAWSAPNPSLKRVVSQG